MALGGGKFTSMNKQLAGAYVNTISEPKALSLFGDRGTVAVALTSNYGNKGEIIKLKSRDFELRCSELFGYDVWADEVKNIRELMSKATEIYVYQLAENVKAKNDIAVAKRGGTRGNDISIKIQTNINDEAKKDVITMVDDLAVDIQTVNEVSQLSPNKYVDFLPSADISENVVKKSLEGGTTGTATIKEHTEFLARMESETFDVLLCPYIEKEVQQIYMSFTKRLRNEIGILFALVLQSIKGENLDFYDDEGIVAVYNTVLDENSTGTELTYYTAGLYASTPIGVSNIGAKYSGEYEVDTNLTQLQLVDLKNSGKFVYHKEGEDVIVLEDINTLVTTTEVKGEEFKENQVIRVVDALSIADAQLFTKTFIGSNIDLASMESFQNGLVAIREKFVDKKALRDFDKDSIIVSTVEGQRGSIKATSGVVPPDCFKKLYLTNVLLRKDIK